MAAAAVFILGGAWAIQRYFAPRTANMIVAVLVLVGIAGGVVRYIALIFFGY